MEFGVESCQTMSLHEFFLPWLSILLTKKKCGARMARWNVECYKLETGVTETDVGNKDNRECRTMNKKCKITKMGKKKEKKRRRY